MLNADFTNFPVLTTERLVLRQLTLDDAPQIQQLRSDPQINKYVGRAASTGIEDAIAFIQKIHNVISNKEGIYWVITLKGNDTLVGTICFYNFDIERQSIEIGYELMVDFQGKGIMAEAAEAVIDYGFEQIQASVITALPEAGNTASIILLEKFKFGVDNDFYADGDDDLDGMLVYVLKGEDRPNVN